jgi:hypothetical protein
VTRGSLTLLAAGLTVLVSASPVRADISKDECVDANTRAQSLRRSGRFGQAREQLRVCGDPSCPALVRVTVDGQPLADRLDGTALAIEPGEHAFRFDAPGHVGETRTFVVKEGEKDRRERIVLEATQGPVALSPVPVPREVSGGLGSQRVVGLAVGATGLGGIAVGAVFGGLAIARWNDSKDECATSTNCPLHMQAVSDHGATVTFGAVSTVAFIAGGTILAGGAVLFLTGGKSNRTGVGVVALPGLDSFRVAMSGRF